MLNTPIFSELTCCSRLTNYCLHLFSTISFVENHAQPIWCYLFHDRRATDHEQDREKEATAALMATVATLDELLIMVRQQPCWFFVCGRRSFQGSGSGHFYCGARNPRCACHMGSKRVWRVPKHHLHSKHVAATGSAPFGSNL